MTLKEIYSKLKSLNIPVAYDHFNSAQTPPFCVYTISDDISGADLKNMLRNRSVRLELYTDKKNETLETEVENLFNEYEMSKETIWIQSENMFETIFSFDIYMKG